MPYISSLKWTASDVQQQLHQRVTMGNQDGLTEAQQETWGQGRPSQCDYGNRPRLRYLRAGEEGAVVLGE